MEVPRAPTYLNIPEARRHRLKVTRAELGWSLAQMAEAMGLAASTIAAMERGSRPISKRTELAVRWLAGLPYRQMSHAQRIANETAWAMIEDAA